MFYYIQVMADATEKSIKFKTKLSKLPINVFAVVA